MKKFFVFALTAVLLILTGCSNTSQSETPHLDNSGPSESIAVRSVQELHTMQKMLACEDEQELTTYLRGIEGGGAHSSQDLRDFISTVSSAPYLQFSEGKIIWISCSSGQSNATEKEYKMLYISTELDSGDWFRFEYMLNITDISEQVNSMKNKGEFSNSTINNEIPFKDGNVVIYSETKSSHPSGVGTITTWVAEIYGVFARVVYYSQNGDIDFSIFDDVDRINVFDTDIIA